LSIALNSNPRQSNEASPAVWNHSVLLATRTDERAPP